MPIRHRAPARSLAALVLLAAAPAFAGPAQGAECELNEVFRTGGAPTDAILAHDHAFIATHIGVEMLSLADPAAIAPAGALTTLPATSLALLGDVMLVAVDQDGGEDALHLFDISAAPQTQALGSVSWPDGFDSAQHVAARGGLALVAAGSVGALLIDVSDPAHPHILATIPPPVGAQVRRVALFDGAAALFLSNGTILTYDLGDPANPTLLAQEAGSPIEAITTYGAIVHTAGNGLLTTIDLSDPSDPATLSTLPIAWAYDLDRVGDVVHVGIQNDGSLVRVDVTNPVAPALMNACCAEGGLASSQIRVASSANATLLVSPRQTRLIGAPGGVPTVLGREPRMQLPRGMAVENDLLLVNSTFTAQLYRVQEDGALDGLGDFSHAAISPPVSNRAAALKGDRAAVIARSPIPQGGNILHLLDISDPEHPVPLSAAAIPGTGATTTFFAHRIEIVGPTVFVLTAFFDEAFSRVHAFNGAVPTLKPLGQWSATDISARGDVVYFLEQAAGAWRLRAMDALHPIGMPELGASDPLPPGTGWRALRLDGHRAYMLSDSSMAVATIDISDASDPRVLGVATLAFSEQAASFSALAFEVHDEVAYVSFDPSGLGPDGLFVNAFDLSDPTESVRIAARQAPWPADTGYATTKTPTGILFDGYHMAYVACPCPGDTNGDGAIDFEDLNLIISAFNTSSGDPNFNPGADLNGDDAVDFADLNLVVSLFNTAC